MLSYFCLKCTKNAESKNSKVGKTNNGRMMLLWKCAECDCKKSKFIKYQETTGLLSSLGIKTTLGKIPLESPFFKNIQQVNTRYTMNEIVNKPLYAGKKIYAWNAFKTAMTYIQRLLAMLKKAKKEYKSLKKQEIHYIFIKTNQIKLLFSMTWLMEILNI